MFKVTFIDCISRGSGVPAGFAPPTEASDAAAHAPGGQHAPRATQRWTDSLE